MDEAIAQLIGYVGTIVLLAVAYGETFGGLQTELTQAVVDAGKVRSRYKRLVNFAVGIIVAVGIFTVLSFWVDVGWRIVPVGVLAGITSSVKAGKVYDQLQQPRVEEPVEGPPAPERKRYFTDAA